jgi:hypothetical protein
MPKDPKNYNQKKLYFQSKSEVPLLKQKACHFTPIEGHSIKKIKISSEIEKKLN